LFAPLAALAVVVLGAWLGLRLLRRLLRKQQPMTNVPNPNP
jgi:hypothetical protein